MYVCLDIYVFRRETESHERTYNIGTKVDLCE